MQIAFCETRQSAEHLDVCWRSNWSLVKRRRMKPERYQSRINQSHANPPSVSYTKWMYRVSNGVVRIFGGGAVLKLLVVED